VVVVVREHTRDGHAFDRAVLTWENGPVPGRVPIVDYLVLDEAEPHLVANACRGCGALYFDRRNACARCGGRTFDRRRLQSQGTVRAFTIVARAAPGIPTPYVSAVVDLEGGGVVKANLVGVDPSPEAIRLGMPVRMTTFVAGTDEQGTEAVAFGYEPA
jgi:uncharacterized OB-fold protein